MNVAINTTSQPSSYQHGKDMVQATTLTCLALFNSSEHQAASLALDGYQRGYVWDVEKITQMAKDLKEFQDHDNQGLPYYMGTLLLHQDKDKRYIIDGQQRITSLCLLHLCLTGELPRGHALHYSASSARRIRHAYKALSEIKTAALPSTKIFEQVIFTVISVREADLAFTFFDTQNNRGLPLNTTDLLKAYHLRAIKGQTEALDLQRESAARWEKIQRQPSVLSSGDDFTPYLFRLFLWRARMWQGKRIAPATPDGLLAEFQNNTWQTDADEDASVDTIPIYTCRNNKLASAMQLKNGQCILKGGSLVLNADPANIPMAARQPIYAGLGFFLFAEKYTAILQNLMNNETKEPEVKFFRQVYQTLLLANQIYLRETFMVSSLLYVDQFGYVGLSEFALRLEYALGSIRLNKAQIKRETAANYFRDGQLNLLDVITQSYHPRQVFNYLKQQEATCKKIYAEETVVLNKGVQGQYKSAVLEFYNCTEQDNIKFLADKHDWLESKLKYKGKC